MKRKQIRYRIFTRMSWLVALGLALMFTRIAALQAARGGIPWALSIEVTIYAVCLFAYSVASIVIASVEMRRFVLPVPVNRDIPELWIALILLFPIAMLIALSAWLLDATWLAGWIAAGMLMFLVIFSFWQAFLSTAMWWRWLRGEKH